MCNNCRLPAAVAIGVLVTLLQCAPPALAASPCFSQLQVLGSHNSYHKLPAKPISDLLKSPLAKVVLPSTAYLPESWEYEHPDITQQLDAGIRAFEFDIHADPVGGLYSSPAMLKFAGVDAKLPDPALSQPGYKVHHATDIDFSTNCVTLVACLTPIKQWSDAHPNHVPITVILQTSFGQTDLVTLLGTTGKIYVENTLGSSTVPGPKKLVTEPAASKELLGSIESEILSVFPQDKIITPDSVRSALNLPPTTDLTKTLLQAPTQTSCPWPDLETLRGKVIFGFIFPDQPTVDMYKSLHPGQKGAIGWMVWDSPSLYIPEAVMYTAGGGLDLSLAGGVPPPNMPKNASAIVANLAKDISDKSSKGYLVRARADADTVEARLGYVGRANAVLNSSANIVATDYALPTNVIPGINYSVKLYGNQPARCVNNAALGAYNGAEVSCTNLSNTPTTLPLTAVGATTSNTTTTTTTTTADGNNSNGNVPDVDGSSNTATTNTPAPTATESNSAGGPQAPSNGGNSPPPSSSAAHGGVNLSFKICQFATIVATAVIVSFVLL